MIKKINILGVGISVLNLDLAVREVLSMISSGDRGCVCVVPVATLVDCQQDSNYKEVVNRANMATPDGMPVVWVAKYLKGAKTIERTYGPDLMLACCDQGQTQGLKHFFYGANQQTLEQLSIRLKAQFPYLHIAGMYAPDFMPKAQIALPEVITRINAAQADIIWVGLGSPKQDFWMSLNRPLLDAPVIVGIGAAFDFLAGIKPQAPRWMGRMGLEWFFRLCCEPRRLWKRYLIGNALFIFYLVKDLFVKESTNA